MFFITTREVWASLVVMNFDQSEDHFRGLKYFGF